METKEQSATNAALEATFARLAETLPEMLDRRQAATAAGLTYKSFANLDSRGLGPERFRMNGRTRYERESFLAWLRSRVTLPGDGPKRGRPLADPQVKARRGKAQAPAKATATTKAQATTKDQARRKSANGR